MIDPHNMNGCRGHIDQEQDTVRVVQQLSQAPVRENALPTEWATLRLVLQTCENIEQAIEPTFGPNRVMLFVPNLGRVLFASAALLVIST